MNHALLAFLTRPSSEALWDLQVALLAVGGQADTPIQRHLDASFRFLNNLQARATAREYSHFASLLDMGAVGGVALQNLLELRPAGDWWLRAGFGAIGESLMVLAARQYVKAWDVELQAEFASAAWYLTSAFWSLSQTLQPELAAADRIQLVDDLVGPLRQQALSTTQRAALAVRLFQLLLLISLPRSDSED